MVRVRTWCFGSGNRTTCAHCIVMIPYVCGWTDGARAHMVLRASRFGDILRTMNLLCAMKGHR